MHSDKVVKNRQILKKLINAACFLAKQELPFRVQNENKYSGNMGNYKELLISDQEFHPLSQEHLDPSTIFRGTSVRTQNDLINSVAHVIKHDTKKLYIIYNFYNLCTAYRYFIYF